MKNKLRKVLSLMLVIAMLGGFAVPVLADAPASAERATTVPTVYVQGYGAEIYKDANNINSEIIVGGDVPFLSDGVLGCFLL